MIALCRVSGENAPFAQHLGQQRLERTDLILFLRDGALGQHHPCLDFRDMQHMLLRLLSPIHLFSCSFQNVSLNCHMNCLLIRLPG